MEPLRAEEAKGEMAYAHETTHMRKPKKKSRMMPKSELGSSPPERPHLSTAATAKAKPR